MEQKLYLAAIHKVGISQKKLHIIFSNNSDYKSFYNDISFHNLKKYSFSDKQIEFILKNKNKCNLLDLSKIVEKRGVRIITINDDEFPDYLKQIHNIPYLLYIRGKIDNSPKISFVGTRLISNYGEKVIENIVGDISKYFTIVSGGAAGCDTKSHIVSLNNKAKTISVIGTGIDIDYPVYNKKLYDDIVENNGAIISIFPIGEVGNPYNFPVRNEIVAGLSVGVVVIEARKQSGTLITSKLALDLGKDLFAVPGDIFKLNSEGCNNLIKDGMAKLTICSDDILVEYNISEKNSINKNKKIDFIDKIEENIYNTLILENLTIDDLMKKLGLTITSLSFKLSMMEINNLIKKGLGGKYEVI